MEMNHGFGELSRERGNANLLFAETIMAGIFSVVLLFYRHYSSLPLFSITDFWLVAGVLIAYSLGKLVLRPLLLFNEERHHLAARYNKSFIKALKCCLPINEMMIIYLFVFAFTLVYIYSHWDNTDTVLLPWPAFLTVVIVSSYAPQRLSRAEISHLNETENKHVADGLAWSYYFGYLKLLLPSLDDMISQAVRGGGYEIGNKDIRDVLSYKKLLIVIPKDCYCYASFTKIDNRIVYKTSMPPQKRTRGAVQERVYKNTLYQINVTPESPSLYVLMEYATPLLSMFDMKNHAESKFTQDDLESQVQEFAKKLKEILDRDPECKGRYELVLVGSAHKNLAETIHDIVNKVNVNI